jgi:FKBP-type peptidyl-prolyl cis-trans isomerase FkpA
MKLAREYLITVLITTFSTLSYADSETGSIAKIISEQDKMSYALGSKYATTISTSLHDVKRKGGELNREIFLLGFTDTYKGKSKLTKLDILSSISDFEKYITESEADMVKKQMIESAKFLRNNARKDGVFVTDSGLQYQVLKLGQGEVPLPSDMVVVNFEASFIDGEIYSKGENVELPLNVVIKGWSEGLQMMPVGSEFFFTMSHELAYSIEGNTEVPPYSTLNFKIELLEIIK